MKYASVSKLPPGPRIAVCGLYLIAVGVTTAAGWIASDGTSTWLVAACWAVQVGLLFHIIRRA